MFNKVKTWVTSPTLGLLEQEEVVLETIPTFKTLTVTGEFMATKTTKIKSKSKKVKQVAKRKFVDVQEVATPLPVQALVAAQQAIADEADDLLDDVFSDSLPVGTMVKADGSTVEVPLGTTVDPTTNVAVTADGFEFGVGIKPSEARLTAIERSKKVELKVGIKTLIETFRTKMEGQLKELSDKVEGQLKPLVEAVSTIAVAKKDLTYQLDDFQEVLNLTLGLNDELEPMDIGYGAEEYFADSVPAGQPGLDEMLVDGIEDAAWTQDIPTTEVEVGPRQKNNVN